MTQIFQQIKELNLAYKKLCVAIKIMEKYVSKNNNLEIYLYRIKKAHDDFQKCLLTEFKKENTNEEFKKIVKNFEKEI